MSRQSSYGDKNTCELSRRQFLTTASSAALGSSLLCGASQATAAPSPNSASETAVKALYDSLSEEQKKVVAFDWDYVHPKRGLLRTHTSNNWRITKPGIVSDFFTKQQQTLIREAYTSLFSRDWQAKMIRQCEEDTRKPWGEQQSIALFGAPGDDKFEMVISGRHLTVRADGNTQAHVALGGPRVHGHGPKFNEGPTHPDNVFWPQALQANKIYEMLSGTQREQARVAKTPVEHHVALQGDGGTFTGIPIASLSADQKKVVEATIDMLAAPYRDEDRSEIAAALKQQGGIDKCSLAFYQQGDLGKDEIWDNWRIEGPSFVWYFRGAPHVHIWINIADSSDVELNAQQL
ncbi:MAG: DUF3500 domain-containing protein [Kiritimatiellia bacterium]|jgi:hypothetical protein|nr:DUF3500 domain-containing protein [Kiritimatiellia bacterium]